jgi:hypothetical protein
VADDKLPKESPLTVPANRHRHNGADAHDCPPCDRVLDDYGRDLVASHPSHRDTGIGNLCHPVR